MTPPWHTTEAYRVLVVDDNRSIHEDFRKILCPRQSAGSNLDDLKAELFDFDTERQQRLLERFEVDSAYQGREAVQLVSKAVREGRPYALAFVDVRMPPGLDGVETIRDMWQVDPELQAVICSAYSDYTWSDIIRCLGHSDGLLVLRKPFDTVEALQIAHALVRKWLLGQQAKRRLDDLESMVQQRTRDLEQANLVLKEEVAQRKKAEDALTHLATHDSLTGLPNRILLYDRLNHALARAQRHRSLVALLLVDLDHFKEVNDSYGHAAGDQLLQQVAQKLRDCVRACDTVARMGGDEFVVVLEDLSEPEQVAIVAKRILESVATPTDVHGHEVSACSSIGIAVYPSDCEDAEQLLKSADLAMYQAKKGGRDRYQYYAPGMRSSSRKALQMKAQLQRAVARNQLVLWYQPLVELTTGAISGMEALLRWEHPELGLVPPMRFVPLAEKSDVIVPIGEWVLRSACSQLAQWHQSGWSDLAVAVNVSARQLHQPGFVDVVCCALEEARLEPRHLELELTESAAMRDVEHCAGIFQELKGIGVRTVIDDFGSGYSSLLRLKKLPIHALKIDRFFVHDIATDPRNAAIVRAIVNLAHSLGIRVVAEGVETAEQLDLLRNLDWDLSTKPLCDRVQGFLLSRPLPPEGATTFLRNTTARRSMLKEHASTRVG